MNPFDIRVWFHNGCLLIGPKSIRDAHRDSEKRAREVDRIFKKMGIDLDAPEPEPEPPSKEFLEYLSTIFEEDSET